MAVSPGRRFLFVAPPIPGHIRPVVPLGRELLARGHDVAWALHPEVAGELSRLPKATTFIAAPGVPEDVADAVRHHTGRSQRGPAAFRSLWDEYLLPVNRQMLEGIEDAVDAFAPDIVVADHQALAAVAVAERRGVPWATTATTSAELTDPLAALPNVQAWLRDRLTQFLTDANVEEATASAVDPRRSPHLIIAFTTAALIGAETASALPPQCALVGASIDPPEPLPSEFADWLSRPGPHVLISLGTVNWRGGQRFFAAAAEAFAHLDHASAVVVAPPDMVPEPPANMLAVPWAPHTALMPHLSAVVSHGGHNTVAESLAHGNPLIIAPIRDDQPLVAHQVAQAGAGIRVKYSRVRPDQLRDAVSQVLHEPGYRAAARHVQASFDSGGGPAAAAERLEETATTKPTSVETA